MRPKKMKSDKRKRKGRHPNQRKQGYYCRECGYRSDRRFNVDRHAERIHSESITKKCCNIFFSKKSDWYHHIEDRHPNMRSSCFVSKNKYKIYGNKMKLSTDFRYKIENVTNTVNSDNSDKSATIRRSMRIHEQIMKRGELTLKEISTESECEEYDDDDMDIDYYDCNESEELTYDLHEYQQINSLSSVSEEYENSRCEESENTDDNANNNYYQNNIINTIKDKNILQSFEVDTKINIQENKNTMSQLPLKKRILCEVNNNVDKSSIPKNNGMKIKKILLDNKENQNPVDIILNGYQGATIVKQILTVEQSMQIWNSITQRQRDYLRYIDFNSF